MTKSKMSDEVKYTLEKNGQFVIENYNHARPFSNFFPGIAGIWGIPMWAFYVNRGQCIASFGIESKGKAIMEFQPANKSYRLTSLQGFRTFIKATSGKKTVYWEPFQEHLKGTDYRKRQTMSTTAHDLTLREVNADLGLTAEVNFFTLPEESYPALVRRVTIKNNGTKNWDIELIDGLPVIIPYGMNDWVMKHMSRTIEAWYKVTNLKKNAPFYQLSVESSDKPEVIHIEEGNFYFAYDADSKDQKLLSPIVEASCIFGQATDFLSPVEFCQSDFKLPREQQTSNRTPSAMSYASFKLGKKAQRQIVSLCGYAYDLAHYNKILRQATKKGFIDQKVHKNREIIDGIKNFALTKSASPEFDLYSSYTFLDNIMRGGLPVSLKTGDGYAVFNVYSRKHGDLERDYNDFRVAPTFYSQGNGNYRDVNQNRRNDVWFNAHVGDSLLTSFLNLSQADGYNPLVVKGTTFSVSDRQKCKKVISDYVSKADRAKLSEIVEEGFLPGDLLVYIVREGIKLEVSSKIFLGKIMEACQKQELADHGEGFWSDHWTYNLDLIESYLSVYPDRLKDLLLGSRNFYFYQNTHYVLPRDQRYILTDKGVRQYESVGSGTLNKDDKLRTRKGSGAIYRTHLICKLLCLVANKVATLDPSGIGIEMEADKPNWYDALNGLPGLLGSSVSETFELKRLSIFLLEALDKLDLKGDPQVPVFEELANFIFGLTNVLALKSEPLVFWQKANDLKEHYRAFVRQGIEGSETDLTISEIKHFLELVIARTQKGIEAARNDQGFLATYFYHDVIQYGSLEKHGDEHSPTYVEPRKFKKHTLPLFLEGYVHAMRVTKDSDSARLLYDQVRESDLYDQKLKMYKVNADITGESEEIGRTRIFPSGWLENGSIWLHMEYKFMLELLRCGLYEEFYQNFRSVMVPFLNPEEYGRSILENSSFIVSSAHEDKALHGQGFVARLSGSTAEFMHIWLLMNIGKDPFAVNAKGELTFTLNPALPGWLFTTKKMDLPKNTYAFNLFEATLVVYHNPHRRNTYGTTKPPIQEIHLTYANKKKPVIISEPSVSGSYADDIRNRKVQRIDVFFG